MIDRSKEAEETERKKHRESMDDLSKNLEIPRENVAAVYENELVLIGRLARIREYLPILVSRRVRNLLRG